MLGALHILHRQMTELGHRRKLLAFLFLLPLLLMFLFGAALGDEKIPLIRDSSQPGGLQELRSDQNLATVFTIIGSRMGNWSQPVKILAATVKSPTNPSSKAFLYIVPNSQNTSLILVDMGSSSYYYVVLDNNSSQVEAAAGPRPLPVGSGFTTVPQVNVQPLYSEAGAARLAQDGVAIFRLGLNLELTPEKRLLDVIFPELVGLEIGWVGILGTAVTAVEDRVSGARRRILMTPLSRASFVLGSVMASLLLIGLQLIVLFAAAILVFHLDIAGSTYDLVPIIAAASFSVVGLGMIISHFSKTPDEAFYLSALVNLPMGFLASQYIPQAHNQLSLFVSSIFPMTYANRALTSIMVDGASFLAVLPELVSLGIFAAALYSLGTILLMRER